MTPRILCTGLAAGFAMMGVSVAASAQELSAAAAERLAAYENTGETRSCIGLNRIRSIDPIDDNHFLVELRNREVWLNTTRGRCSGAAQSFNRLQYRTSGTQLCSGQIVEIIDNATGMSSGACGLGQFELLRPVEANGGASR